MIENNPDCVRGNESNAVIVDDYEGPVASDMTLYAVRELLEDISQEQAPIPEILRSSRYVRRRPADEADPAWLVYRIDPAAAVRPPREWDVLPRLGWALRYLRHDLLARLPALTPAAAPLARDSVAGRWQSPPPADGAHHASSSGSTASSGSSSSGGGGSGRRRAKPRKGKGRRRRGLPTPPAPQGRAVSRSGLVVQGPSRLLAMQLGESSLPLKGLYQGVVAVAKLLMAVIAP
eukprot:EG_transcript_22668